LASIQANGSDDLTTGYLLLQLNVLQQGKLKGSWHVELSGEAKAPEIKEGKATKKPTISATMSDDVMVKLASGKLQPMNAFMSGKVTNHPSFFSVLTENNIFFNQIKLAGNIMMVHFFAVFFLLDVFNIFVFKLKAQKLNTVFGSGNLAQKGRVIAQDFISKNEYLKAKL